jgi:hypothetical protein
LRRDLESGQKASGQWIQNQRLVQQGEVTENRREAHSTRWVGGTTPDDLGNGELGAPVGDKRQWGMGTSPIPHSQFPIPVLAQRHAVQSHVFPAWDELNESIQSLAVAVVMSPTQSNQPRLAGQTARYINAVGGVFLPCVFIGYILGELRSIKYRTKQVDVQSNRAIAVFPNREAAGQALDKLVLSGFLLKKIFLIGKQSASNDQSVDTEIISALVNQARIGAITETAYLRKGLVIGKVSGGLVGLLLGLNILARLGVSQIALVPAVGFTLLCGGICTVAGRIVGALIGLRMTKKQARKYGERVVRGNYLLIVNGTKDDIKQAERILNNSEASLIQRLVKKFLVVND